MVALIYWIYVFSPIYLTKCAKVENKGGIKLGAVKFLSLKKKKYFGGIFRYEFIYDFTLCLQSFDYNNYLTNYKLTTGKKYNKPKPTKENTFIKM